MATSVDDVLDSILAKKIDRQDALRSFNGLSEAEQHSLLAGLRARLQDAPQATPAAGTAGAGPAPDCGS